MKLSRRHIALAGSGLLLLLALVFGFGPLVRGVARSKAAARGIELSIGSTRPGWFALVLSDVVLQPTGAPALEVRLDSVRVGVSALFSLRSVDVNGGVVSVTGSPQLVADQLEGWRARFAPKPTAGAGNKAGLELDVADLKLSWSGLNDGEGTFDIQGIRASRHGAEQKLALDSAKLALPWGSVVLESASVELAPTPAGSALAGAKVKRLSGELALGSDKADAEDPPAPAPAPEPPPPPPEVSSSKNGSNKATKSKAAKREKLSKAKAKSKGTEKRVALAPDTDPEVPTANTAVWQRLLSPVAQRHWERLEPLLARARIGVARFVAPDAKFAVEELRLRLVRGEKALNLGPAPFVVQRTGDKLSGTFTPRSQNDDKKLAIEGTLPLSGDSLLELLLEGGPISFRSLGVREGDMGLVGVEHTSLTLETRATLTAGGTIQVHASGSIAELGIQHPGLAPEPLRDIDLGWSGEATLDLGHQRLMIEKGELDVERARVLVDLALEAAQNELKVELTARVPPTPCADLFGAAPRALLPDLEGLELGGKFGLDVGVHLDTNALADTKVTWDWDNKCSVKETPEAIDPERFREPFEHTVKDEKGDPVELLTGPTTDNWVPLDEISRHMETALIVCEDSRFWSHRGFDSKAIQDSIATNLKAGQFVRGASTLSMQLAKNLYLGNEKTLSRKLQQAAFTLLLEERMSKQEILELYLNVVEFGPGIYGIRQAAQHYFSAHPSELSLGQAMYLATLLPRPKRSAFTRDGSLSKTRAELVRYLIRVAHKIHRITDDELEEGLKEELLLGQPHPALPTEMPFGVYPQSEG